MQKQSKNIINISFIIISILFSLGGAFNVGTTRFWMSVPFMFILILLSFKRNIKYGIATIIFIIVCIIINLTIYKNSFVFPILKSGVSVEIQKDGLYESFSDGSGSFVDEKNIYINKPTQEQQEQLDNFLKDDSLSLIKIVDSATVSSDDIITIHKVKAGQKLPILRVFNFGGIDSQNQNYLVTELGDINEDEIEKGSIIITQNTLVQSKWSKYLGNLMYYPLVPILFLNFINH